MLFSLARSARMACWLSALSRLSSSRSSTPKPGPRRTSVAPNRPPSRTVRIIRLVCRNRRESTWRLPGARRLEFESCAPPDHTEFLFLLGDIHAPVGFAEQLVGIHAVFGEHGVPDAQPQSLLRENVLARFRRDSFQALDLLL